MEFEVLEVADENVARPLALGQRVKVAACLLVGSRQIAPDALLLYDQDSRPKEVDEPARVVELLHPLLIAGHRLPAHAEDAEEVVVEALGLAFLVSGVRPLLGEGCCSNSDLIPGEAHAAAYCFRWLPSAGSGMVSAPWWSRRAWSSGPSRVAQAMLLRSRLDFDNPAHPAPR